MSSCTVILSSGIPFMILVISYKISVVLGIIAESIMCFYLMAAKCLKDESMKVYKDLKIMIPKRQEKPFQ